MKNEYVDLMKQANDLDKLGSGYNRDEATFKLRAIQCRLLVRIAATLEDIHDEIKIPRV